LKGIERFWRQELPGLRKQLRPGASAVICATDKGQLYVVGDPTQTCYRIRAVAELVGERLVLEIMGKERCVLVQEHPDGECVVRPIDRAAEVAHLL
jgi:hypothetical protein